MDTFTQKGLSVSSWSGGSRRELIRSGIDGDVDRAESARVWKRRRQAPAHPILHTALYNRVIDAQHFGQFCLKQFKYPPFCRYKCSTAFILTIFYPGPEPVSS
jgi:hypothetical protein